MIGSISVSGILIIDRAGRKKEMECNFGKMEHCNDKCPSFNEPYPDFDNNHGYFSLNKKTALNICNGSKLSFSKFQDFRGYQCI